MNRLVLRLCIVLMTWFGPTLAFAAEVLKEDDIFGDWVFPENGSVIKFYRCGENICGKIAKVADPSRRDVHNPDPALRNRSVIGVNLFSSTDKKGPTTWRGKLYNTLDGSTYEGTLNLLDKNKFVVVGCIFGNLLCDAKTFIRSEQPKTATKPEPKAAAKNEPAPSARTTQPKPAQETAAAAPARAKPPKPSEQAVAAAAQPQPTRADFDAFLSSRGMETGAVRTAEQREMLFIEFMSWWEKKSTARAN